MRTLRALSALLTYPEAPLRAALPEIRQQLSEEPLLGKRERESLLALVDHLGSGELFDRQEEYGLLFDRTRSLSLHLFEHVHGESRDRGQAMVDLLGVYTDAGFTPTAVELPDFLPLFLEYASTRDPQEAISLIGEPAHVLIAIRERLAKRCSPYEAVFEALVTLADAKPDAEALARLRAEPDPEPDDLAALDAAWEEEEVRFGMGSGSDACGVDSLNTKLRAARRPAEGMEAPPARRPVVTHSTPSSRA